MPASWIGKINKNFSEENKFKIKKNNLVENNNFGEDLSEELIGCDAPFDLLNRGVFSVENKFQVGEFVLAANDPNGFIIGKIEV